jgi:hypothetical protein
MPENITENYLERRKVPRPCPTNSDFTACPMYNSHNLSEEQIIFITMKAVELAKLELIKETKDYINDRIDDSIPEIAEKATKNVIDNFCMGAGRSIGRTIKDKFFLAVGVIVLSLATGISFHDAWTKLKDTLL